ncbi:MAG: ABC transporter ATP-binding protein [Clostridia bacterium]|nr:ABC transporter ATP-binding protein [Clostridia bacterium]
MIEIRNLSVGFSESEPVLSDVDMTLPEGKVTVFLGPNGCGKTTLMRTILGLQPSKKGTILIDGQDIQTMSVRERAQKMAYLSQSDSIPAISVMKMVMHGRFPYLNYPRRYRDEDYRIAEEALKAADAYELRHRSMTKLSGGQRQKVYLAMVLAQQTETIFMDEPTTYLDAGHQLEVMRMARRLADDGHTVVMVLHELSQALRTADTLAVFDHGRMRLMGTPDAVYDSGILNEVFNVSVKRAETEDGTIYYCV